MPMKLDPEIFISTDCMSTQSHSGLGRPKDEDIFCLEHLFVKLRIKNIMRGLYKLQVKTVKNVGSSKKPLKYSKENRYINNLEQFIKEADITAKNELLESAELVGKGKLFPSYTDQFLRTVYSNPLILQIYKKLIETIFALNDTKYLCKRLKRICCYRCYERRNIICDCSTKETQCQDCSLMTSQCMWKWEKLKSYFLENFLQSIEVEDS